MSRVIDGRGLPLKGAGGEAAQTAGRGGTGAGRGRSPGPQESGRKIGRGPSREWRRRGGPVRPVGIGIRGLA